MTPTHDRPTVADLVVAALARKGLSMREAARRTDGQISHSQLARIAHGQSVRVRPATLTALSSALGIPASKLRAANGSEPTVRAPFVLPERAGELNAGERRAVASMVTALLAAHDRARR